MATGSLISQVSSDVNIASKVQTDTLAVGSEGSQIYKQVEEEGPDRTMSIEPLGGTSAELEMVPGPSPASMTSVDTIKSKEALYIAAP